MGNCGLRIADCGFEEAISSGRSAIGFSLTAASPTAGRFPADRFRPLRSPKSAIRNARAFTLLELMLVIALLAVLAVVALPLYSGALARRQLAESADQFRSLMYTAAGEAKQAGRRMELRFTDPPAASHLAPSGKELAPSAARAVEVHVERDPLGAPGQFEPVLADWARWAVAGANVQIVKVEVAEPVQVCGEEEAEEPLGGGEDEPGSAPASVLFSADGRSQVGDVTVTLMNERLDGYRVQLRAATGQATIEHLPPPEANQ